MTCARVREATGNQRPWPADKVERWSIDRLIPYAKNARTHTDAQVAAIAAGGGFLEGEVAWQQHDRFFIEDRVFRQHSVEIGAEAVGQVVGLDRSAKPARMKATRRARSRGPA